MQDGQFFQNWKTFERKRGQNNPQKKPNKKNINAVYWLQKNVYRLAKAVLLGTNYTGVLKHLDAIA